MKKNKLFVLGLVTVFVALVSLTLVSSTWAKYTSTADGFDTARVAYWGFEEDDLEDSVIIEDLFVNSYNNNAVNSLDSNVIAPGASKTIDINVKSNSKAPEVKYNITYTLTITDTGSEVDEKTLLEHLNDNTNFYWTFKLNNGNQEQFDDYQDLIDAVEELSGDHAANESYNETFYIGWVWTFEDLNNSTNELDTLLGNGALDLSTITVTLKVDATQIQ